MSGRVRAAGLAFGIGIFCIAGPATAVDIVGKTTADVTWTTASGPALLYGVFVSRNGGAYPTRPDQVTDRRVATVGGSYGDSLRVKVRAYGYVNGAPTTGPFSPESDIIHFVDASTSGTGTGGTGTGGTDTGSTGTGGTGSSPSNPAPPPPPVGPAAPYDFDGDGRTDILWRNASTGALSVWLMDGGGPWKSGRLGNPGLQWEVRGSGDFDGDGRADLVLRNSSTEEHVIWFLDGDLVLRRVGIGGLGVGWRVEEIGDYDGDGRGDLFWRIGRPAEIWFMNGGVVELALPGPVADPDYEAKCSPDMNGDGISDLVLTNGYRNPLWLMDGAVAVAAAFRGPRVTYWSVGLICDDTDGDGRDDVLWYDPIYKTASLWAINGLTVEAVVSLPSPSGSWQMETGGDFDGDGLANDIYVRDGSTGAGEIWTLHWNAQRTGVSVSSAPAAGWPNLDWQVVSP